MEIKERIREIVEESQNLKKKRNKQNYLIRKEHITDAPYLIIVCVENVGGLMSFKNKCNFEYSTPLSVGMLLAAIQVNVILIDAYVMIN